jgi:hypothetical protein
MEGLLAEAVALMCIAEPLPVVLVELAAAAAVELIAVAAKALAVLAETVLLSFSS